MSWARSSDPGRERPSRPRASALRRATSRRGRSADARPARRASSVGAVGASPTSSRSPSVGAPALAGEREARSRPSARSASVPSLGLDLDRARSPARSGTTLLPLLLEPLDHLAQLELAATSRSRERSGSRASDLGEVELDLDVVDASSRAAWRSARRRRARSGSACASRPEISSTFASTSSSDPNCCSSCGRGLVADPGDAGDVVGGVALEADQVGDQLRRRPRSARSPPSRS